MWLDESVVVTVALISDIMGFPKEGTSPSQYFRGKYNDRRFATNLKKIYNMQHDQRAYHVESINDQVVHIAVRILASKIV